MKMYYLPNSKGAKKTCNIIVVTRNKHLSREEDHMMIIKLRDTLVKINIVIAKKKGHQRKSIIITKVKFMNFKIHFNAFIMVIITFQFIINFKKNLNLFKIN